MAPEDPTVPNSTPDPLTQFTSTYPMGGEVFLRAPSDPPNTIKPLARIAAITFDGDYEQYSIRYADGRLLTVGVHEIDSPST